MKRRVLVIENDMLICRLIKNYMQDHGADVCCTGSPIEALEEFMRQEYCITNQAVSALSSFVLGLLKLLINQKRALIEVHTVSGEAQHLPLPHTGEQRDKIQQLKSVAVDRLQELPDCVIVQRLHLLPHNPGQCAGVRRVYTKIPNSNGLAQGLV